MYIDIYNPPTKYKTLYLDPPWPERGGGKIKRGADRHYNLMSLKDIEALPVKELADPEGCHLYMWVTNNFLPPGLQLLKAWGFEYITLITWQKDRIGLGQYFRGITEHCIFATTATRLPYKYELQIDGTTKRSQGVTGFYEPKTVHSRKPGTMREMIERVSYGPRLELFARESFPGWDCWGNEAPKTEREEEDAWML
jgi:N6-adenosine-specific RNA methylase IME4